MKEDYKHIHFYKCRRNNRDYYENYDQEQKCLAKYGLMSEISVDSNIEDKFENNLLITMKFICLNITIDDLMNRYFFHDYYLNDGIDIDFKQFMNSSRFTIGYLISQKLKNNQNPLKPVLTSELYDVQYDQNNISVSMELIITSR